MTPEATDVEEAAASQPDGRVPTAFALGWQVAELYGRGETQTAAAELGAELPELASLAGSDRRSLRLLQVDAALACLGQTITHAGLSAPNTNAVREAADRGEGRLREAVLTLHTELLQVLIAADFRLGKAYGLGRALCDTCRVESAGDIKERLGRDRLGKLYSRLLDLKSVPLRTRASRSTAHCASGSAGQTSPRSTVIGWNRTATRAA